MWHGCFEFCFSCTWILKMMDFECYHLHFLSLIWSFRYCGSSNTPFLEFYHWTTGIFVYWCIFIPSYSRGFIMFKILWRQNFTKSNIMDPLISQYITRIHWKFKVVVSDLTCSNGFFIGHRRWLLRRKTIYALYFTVKFENIFRLTNIYDRTKYPNK